jgi:hypothetical protein
MKKLPHNPAMGKLKTMKPKTAQPDPSLETMRRKKALASQPDIAIGGTQ